MYEINGQIDGQTKAKLIAPFPTVEGITSILAGQQCKLLTYIQHSSDWVYIRAVKLTH